MKNTARIHTDGVNVYVTSQVRSHPFGRWLITLFTLLVGGTLLFIFAKIDPEALGPVLIPLFLVSFFFYYFMLRYTLWNWFGKERLILNTKNLSYQLDYGWYRTNLKTIKFERLGLSSDFFQQIGGINFYNVHFFKYREEDNLPEEIYRTAVVLPKDQAEEITRQIGLLFTPEPVDYQPIPFSLN